MALRISPTPFFTKPGDVVADIGMCFPGLEVLKRDFNILEFLDLCSGIEAAVLHERIVGLATSIDIGGAPLLGPLFKAGALTPIQLKADDLVQELPAVMERPRASEALQRLEGISVEVADLPLFSRFVTVNALLPTSFYIEETLKIPFALTVQSAPAYLTLPSTERQRALFAGIDRGLAGTYESIRAQLYDLQGNLNGEDYVKIPPIAMEALSSASTFDELGSVVLDLRSKYSAMRRRFTELAAVQRDRNTSLITKREEAIKLLRDVNKLNQYVNSKAVPIRTELAEGIDSTVEAVEGILKAKVEPTAAIEAIKLGKPALDLFAHIMWRLRLRPLLQTVDRYLGAAPADLAAAARVLFDYDMTDQDVSLARSYETTSAKYLKLKAEQVGATQP